MFRGIRGRLPATCAIAKACFRNLRTFTKRTRIRLLGK